MTHGYHESGDFYNAEEFRESIDNPCINALTRLKNLTRQDYTDIQPGDHLSESLGVLDKEDRRETEVKIFTAAFDDLHPILMLEDRLPLYLNGIVAQLVANSLLLQAKSAGNHITQLLPNSDALHDHVAKVWQERELERKIGKGFDVYGFHFLGSIANVSFMPESGSDTWSAGYGLSQHRTLLHSYSHVYEETDGTLHLDPIV